MRKQLILLVITLSGFYQALAGDPRNFLQQAATPAQIKQWLAENPHWISYPDYTNRAGWDSLTGEKKDFLIRHGEQYLKYVWQYIPATAYLEYERSGSRAAMEDLYGANNKALTYLVFAELAEGKGRFLDQIINGVWYCCDMPSWVLSAHLPYQLSHRNLPDYHETVIDLGSSDMGSFLAWTWYFFHHAMDKVNPIVADRLHKTLYDRIVEPYTKRSDYWWQALLGIKDQLVNNWNPWCNFNVLTCYLLIEPDPDKQAAGVYKTMKSTDQFINYVKSDGACEEGPSYWAHAAGKLYDYLELLRRATGGKINLFSNPMIKRMGEYIMRSYVGNGWVVNFADAAAKGGEEASLIYRYGTAVNSEEMQSYAGYLYQKDKGDVQLIYSRDFFKSIESLVVFPSLKSAKPGLPQASQTWYPETEVCFVKTGGGLFFAGKAGFNNESHNHNDVGSFNVYAGDIPFFIDAGVGSYTRQTFGAERYTIWTMQGAYHNLPLINDQQQLYGANFKAADVSFNPAKNIFKLDMAGAYPAAAAVKTWIRTYTVKENELTIDDQFELSQTLAPNKIHFLVWEKPDTTTAGVIHLEKDGTKMALQYNPKQFSVKVDAIPQTDKKLKDVWGDAVYRIRLIALKQALKDKYHFVIRRE